MFGSRIELKTDAQIRTMRKAGLVTRAALDAARAACVPGATLRDVDRAGEEAVQAAVARSNFKGYHGFPGTLCVSPNEVIVHGIPDDRVLEAGDLVSIDGGAIVGGLHGDSAFTMVCGGDEVGRPEDIRLSQVTEEAMWAGIAAFARAKKVGEIGEAIEECATELGPDLGLIEDFTGHGIGTEMHMDPEVLNYRARNMGPKVRPGMVLCIEPMLVLGEIASETLPDEWTVVTKDGSRASHWEHTVARHSKGIWVLTEPDGGEARLAKYGVTPVPLAD
ncbi:type I methionyl aminopeptidase [Brevibacterium samyangense]|uniref:Methionine aminopeptidase n=1 Tax=Brevibacterium samyangense TaxID=366888 RepID=A0ABP5EX55_9MICO